MKWNNLLNKASHPVDKLLEVTKPLQVGVLYKGFLLTYDDVITDDSGWVDPQYFLPEEFDLVLIKLSTQEKSFGWIENKDWFGKKLLPVGKVISWFHPEEGRKKNIKSRAKPR